MTATVETPAIELSAGPEELRRLARTQAESVERAGGLSDGLLRSLRDAGCLRLAVPARFGGRDLGLAAVLELIEALATGDGSVGWAVGQIALSQIMLGYLSDDVLERVYAEGPDVLAAGAAAPKGRATATADGWRVSGQWPLVSGGRLARWVFLQCLVVEDRSVRCGPDGRPLMRMVVLPAAAVTVLPTWDALGLRGTASDDVRVTGALCAEGFSCELASAPPPRAAVARVPPPAQGGLFVAAVVLGLARAALEAVSELAQGGKRPAFSPRRLADSPVFQERLGHALLTRLAARSLLYDELAQAEILAGAGELTEVDEARLRAAAAKAIALGVSAVDEAYALAGASAVYAGSPLQRCLRDAHTATQHFTAGRDFYAALGEGLMAAVEPPGSPASRSG